MRARVTRELAVALDQARLAAQTAQAAKCGCRGTDEYCACQNVVQGAPEPAFDWADLEDDIADAISDSIDMDWSPRIGARYVVDMLKKRKPLPPPPEGDGRCK